MIKGLFGWKLLAAAAGAALSVAACSSSDSNGNSGGNLNGGRGTSDCRGEDPSCSKAEVDSYQGCLTNKCDGVFKECYGDGYASGSFGGACGTYIGCIGACGCNDSACVQKCGQPDQTCTTCILNKLAPCVNQCPAPACYNDTPLPDGGQNNNGTCADLLACCNAFADANEKNACLQEYDAIKSSDSTCGSVYNAFKSAGKCP